MNITFKNKLNITVALLLAIAALLTVIPGFFALAAPEGTDDNEQMPAAEAEPEDLKQYAERIALYCIDTGTMLYSKGANALCPPSASAKLMSALVTVDAISNPDTTVTVTKDNLGTPTELIFGIGDVVSYRDLLTVLLVRGANEAATILSRTVCEKSSDFVELMNKKALLLGMKDTVYANPTGISGRSSTTAEDMVRLLLEFGQNEYLTGLSALSDKKLDTVKATVYSRNFYLSSYYNGGKSYINHSVTGGISGKTDDSGDTLLTLMKKDGYTYAAVISGAARGTDTEGAELVYSYLITNDIVKWGAESFEYKTLIDENSVICSLPVVMGDGTDELAVFPSERVVRYLEKNSDLAALVSYVYTLDSEELEAPVKYGDRVGELTLYYKGSLMAVIPLIVRAGVASSPTDYYLARAVEFLKKPELLKITLLVISVCIIYILVMAIIKGQKRKKRILKLEDNAGKEKNSET